MALNFGKVNRSASFNPTSAFPLDARYYFETLAAAQAAAQDAVEVGSSEGTYYYGENVVVVESGVATLYLIQPNKTLKEVGSVPVGDNKSITVENGIIKIVGFDDAEEGSQPRKKADGTVEWIKPDNTTVEGLQTLVSGLESDVETLQKDKANAADVYTRDEVDNLLSTVFDYKGSVESYDDLPAAPEKGDVWNIETADAENGINAGDNVAWNGEAWDNLGGIVDLSGYAKKSDLEAMQNGQKLDSFGDVEDAISPIEERVTTLVGDDADKSARTIAEEVAEQAITDFDPFQNVSDTEFVVTEQGILEIKKISSDKVDGLPEALTKLTSIEENAQKNIIEIVKMDGEALPITDKGVDIPMATLDKPGVVKSSGKENQIMVHAEDVTDEEGNVTTKRGAMEVVSLNVNKLVQTDGDTLILNGGAAAV